ncbi:MAG: Prolipoprotein diacylglyceryl transferase, partial [uncultured Solirubrobacteraceae bacterium]
VRVELRRLGRDREPALQGDRQAAGLGVGARDRRARRRLRRGTAVLDRPELGRGAGRPARQRVRRLRAHLVRRPARRRPRRLRLGQAQEVLDAGAARLRGRRPADRLRDRAHRLPALRRRRLRRDVVAAVGDAVPRRDGPDDRRGPPDAAVRDALHGHGRVPAVADPRPRAPRRALRVLPRDRRVRAVLRRVRPPQRGRRDRPDRGAARVARAVRPRRDRRAADAPQRPPLPQRADAPRGSGTRPSL